MVNLENLKDIRTDKGLSQIEMSKLIGVSVNTYRNWEQGGNNPNEDNMDKLEKVLNMKGDN